MLDKIKPLTDNIKIKSAFIKIKEYLHSGADLCKNAYQRIYKIFDLTGKMLYQMGISANVVTVTGFVIGLLAINFLSLEKYGWALTCIIVNRLFDALDGAIAKRAQPTDFGVFLDAALDYMFYAGVIFGFALARPEANAIPAVFLLFAFTSAACALLAYAVIAYKNNTHEKLPLTQSPFYLGGFAQGSETLIALIVMCILPGLFLPMAIILGILSFVKALSVIVTAYYSFVIAVKHKKVQPVSDETTNG